MNALNVAGGSHHVLVDHVSASWAVDENLSASGAIHDVTVQWSIIAEGLNHSVHAKGAHGYCATCWPAPAPPFPVATPSTPVWRARSSSARAA